jgi:hypothetical protein
MPADDAYHCRIRAAVERLRAEGQEARADRLEQALKRADELLGQTEGDL